MWRRYGKTVASCGVGRHKPLRVNDGMRTNWKHLAHSIVGTVAILASACSSVLPWSKEPIGAEVNMAFVMTDNLVRLQTVRIDNRPGRFLLGSAAPHTVLDPSFAAAGAQTLQISETQTLGLDAATLDLGGVADGIIGAEAWGRYAITIDYHKGLVTWQRAGIHPARMALFSFDAEPAIRVIVDGVTIPVVVDTSSPDTLILPSRENRRGVATVRIAETDFGNVDVRYANVSRARIGNRLLSRFLVTIDYGQRVVGLWRDTRTRIDASLPAPGRT